MRNQRHLRLAGCLIFTIGFALIAGLEFSMRRDATDGFYCQRWSSEAMMQTVSIEDLRDAPLTSLYYIHIQPPGFDAIRALLAVLSPSTTIYATARVVDATLYLLWAILYASMGLLLFVWCSGLMGWKAGFATSLLFLLHPAAIYYATLLDTTFLSSFLILWMYYLLWRIKSGARISIALFAVIALALFFIRSIIQLPTILLFLASLGLLGIRFRKLLAFALIFGSISGLFIAKQYHVFHQLSTSSFTGQNLMWSIGRTRPDYKVYLEDPGNLRAPERGLPDVLTRLHKIDGSTNFNNINYLYLNQQLLGEYVAAIRSTPPAALTVQYIENAWIYFMPSTDYTEHAIVDQLPWRGLYDAIFSYPVLPALLLTMGLLSLWNAVRGRTFTVSLGLLLPAMYVFLICILGEKAENMRYKFFLEPVMFVFLAAECSRIVQAVRFTLLRPAVLPES